MIAAFDVECPSFDKVGITLCNLMVSIEPFEDKAKDDGALGFCRVAACGALKLVQQATLVGLAGLFLSCSGKRAANVVFAFGEIQKNQDDLAGQSGAASAG
jgi:hypothetical protein